MQLALVNSLLKDKFAAPNELVEMKQMVAQFCAQSGCSLILAFYGLSAEIEEQQKLYSNAEIIEFLQESLIGISSPQDSEGIKSFTEKLIIMIEKILSVHKPDKLVALLAKVDIERATEELD